MIGSSLFSLLLSSGLTKIPIYIHGLAALSTLITATSMDSKVLMVQLPRPDIAQMVVYISFLAFELLCGIFFPTYGRKRSHTVGHHACAF